MNESVLVLIQLFHLVSVIYCRISANCQNELLKVACECAEEVISRDPTVIEDTVNCLKELGVLPPLAEALLSPTFLKDQLESRCHKPDENRFD